MSLAALGSGLQGLSGLSQGTGGGELIGDASILMWDTGPDDWLKWGTGPFDFLLWG